MFPGEIYHTYPNGNGQKPLSRHHEHNSPGSKQQYPDAILDNKQSNEKSGMMSFRTVPDSFAGNKKITWQTDNYPWYNNKTADKGDNRYNGTPF